MTFQNQHDHDQKRKNLSDVEPGISLAPPAFNPTASGEEENPQAHESTESANYVRDTPPGELPPPNPHSFYDFSLFLRNLSASNLQPPLDTEQLPQTNFDLMQTHEKRPNQSVSHNKHNAQDSGGKYGSRTPQSQQFRENLGIPEDMSTGEFIAQNRSTGSSLSQRDAQAMVNAKFQRDKEAKIQAKREGNSQESQESESQDPQIESPQNQQSSPPQTPPDGGTKQEGDYIFMTVPIPAGMSESEALVRGVMYVLNVSRSEAENAIEQENIRFNSFNPEGIGTDENGDVLHKIRIPQKYLVRTAHEPLQPGEELPSEKVEILYNGFRKHIAQLENSPEKDSGLDANSLEVIFDSWAIENGFHHSLSPNAELFNLFGLNPLPHFLYANTKEKVVELVLFDRLRSHREGYTAENPKNKSTSLKDYLLDLEIRMLETLPEDLLNQKSSANFVNLAIRWQELRKNLIPYQYSGGITQKIPQPLAEELLRLATEFRTLVDMFPNIDKKGDKEAGEWLDFDVATISWVVNLEDARTEVDNMRLLAESLELGFSIFEFLGKRGRDVNTPVEKMSEAEKAADAAGQGTENKGKQGKRLLTLLQSHPNAQSVEAIFYPEKDTRKMRINDPSNALESGIPLTLFTWFDLDTGEWVLEDLTDLDDKKANRAKGSPDGAPPKELFTALNSRLRFPKGALMYRIETESTFRIMQTEANMEWYEWVRWIGLAGVILGSAFVSGGASIPASVLILTSSTGMAVAELAELSHKNELGVMDEVDVVMHVSGFISSLAGGVGAFTKISLNTNTLFQSQRATSFATKVSQGAFYTEMASDGVGLVIFGAETIETLSGMVEQGAPPAEIARMIALYSALGTMQVVSMRGNAKDIKSFNPADGKGTKPTPKSNEFTHVDEVTGRHEKFQSSQQSRQDRIIRNEKAIEDERKAIENSRNKNEELPHQPEPSLVLAGGGQFASLPPLPKSPLEALFEPIFKAKLGEFKPFGVDRELARKLGNAVGIGLNVPMPKNFEEVASRLKILGLQVDTGTLKVISWMVERKMLILETLRKGDVELVRRIIQDYRMVGYSKAQMDMVIAYRQTVRNPSLVNIEIKSMHDSGYEFRADTKRFFDPKSGKSDYDFSVADLKENGATDAEILEIQQMIAELDINSDKEIQKLVDARAKIIERLDAKRATIKSKTKAGEAVDEAEIDSMNKDMGRRSRMTEHVGEAVLDKLMTTRIEYHNRIAFLEKEIRIAKDPERIAEYKAELAQLRAQVNDLSGEKLLQKAGYELVYPAPGGGSSGSGDVDRIYMKIDNSGKLHVIEVKGGQGQLTGRRLNNLGRFIDEANSKTAQQGTPEYLLEIILTMRNSENAEMVNASKKMLKAIRKNSLVYSEFRVVFDTANKISSISISQFNTSEIASLAQKIN